MRKHILKLGFLMVFMALVPATARMDVTTISLAAAGQPQIEADDRPLSCANGNLEDVPRCEQIEAYILGVTVRIEMQGWIYIGVYRSRINRGAKSHGTVIGGRYLVTHNHFKYSLTTPAPPEGAGFTGITLLTADGDLLVENAPLTAFTIEYEDPETLVLAFVGENGEGLFEALGQPSAEVINWEAVPWQVGMVLAHIDWDETTAYVEWVEVEAVETDQAVPQVQVSNFAKSGASGGGAFWNLYHVGNNWARNVEKDPQSGEVSRLYTIVVLNSSEVAGSLQP